MCFSSTLLNHHFAVVCIINENSALTLPALLSKSRGQVLRLATVLHMLFSINSAEQPLPDEISEAAIKAAVNVVRTASQQTAYIAGRGLLREEYQKFRTSRLI